VHQVKLFKGIESEIGQLEQEINAWLTESGASVIRIFGNIAPQTMKPDAAGGSAFGRTMSPSDLFIAVLYEVL
jgi:hypothetical protein